MASLALKSFQRSGAFCNNFWNQFLSLSSLDFVLDFSQSDKFARNIIFTFQIQKVNFQVTNAENCSNVTSAVIPISIRPCAAAPPAPCSCSSCCFSYFSNYWQLSAACCCSIAPPAGYQRKFNLAFGCSGKSVSSFQFC